MAYLFRLGACLFILIGQSAKTEIIIEVNNFGDDLVFNYSGNIDLDSTLGLDGNDRNCSFCGRFDNSQFINAFRVASHTPSSNNLNDYNLNFISTPEHSLITAGASLLEDGLTSGDGFLFEISLTNENSHLNQIWLEGGYISGTEISGSLTFEDKNLSSAGFNDGIYTWIWGNNGVSDFITLKVNQSPNNPSLISGATAADIEIGGFSYGTLVATDNDGLTDGTYFTITTPPTYGQALINPSSGTWTYIADSTYAGLDPFTVTVTDDLGGTTEQVVSITITAPDSDGDGAYDHQDNCPSVSNTDQANFDGDTFGDVCDSDLDGDGVDNTLDVFPNDPTESSDSDSDNVGDNADNCINAANFDQTDIDSDNLGDACDPDMDGDGIANYTEIRFGGDETDNTDAAVSLGNIENFSETAPADSDLDGVPDDIEFAAGDDTTSSTLQSVIDALSVNKQVPAMSGIVLLALGLSMLSLGAIRFRRK